MADNIPPSASQYSPYDPLLKRISEHAQNAPDKVAATFLLPGPCGGKVQRKLTYRELEDATDTLAERLVTAEGLQAGEW
jgi:acyl-CoA synthetase (AMP-forming)/AMP-acid ligase II